MIRKQNDWISAKVGDEIVMMSATEGKYIGLNQVGARIWHLLDVPQTPESLCATLLDEFDVTPETCRAEVDAFLATLHDYHAIDLAP